MTRALVPLNCNALPNLPAVDQVALLIVPLLPFPDASVTVVPGPSSNAYAATRLDGAASACLHPVESKDAARDYGGRRKDRRGHPNDRMAKRPLGHVRSRPPRMLTAFLRPKRHNIPQTGPSSSDRRDARRAMQKDSSIARR